MRACLSVSVSVSWVQVLGLSHRDRLRKFLQTDASQRTDKDIDFIKRALTHHKFFQKCASA